MSSHYTPYAHLTDNEFSRMLASLEDPSDIEIEAMERLDRLLGDAEAGSAEQYANLDISDAEIL